MRAALGLEQALDDQLIAEKDLRPFFLEKTGVDFQALSGGLIVRSEMVKVNAGTTIFQR
jgi:hypothetical protein